jgi:hypothetical protein
MVRREVPDLQARPNAKAACDNATKCNVSIIVPGSGAIGAT